MRQAQVTEIKLVESVDRYEVSVEVFDQYGDIALFTSAPIFPDADYALEAGYAAVNQYKETGCFPNMCEITTEVD